MTIARPQPVLFGQSLPADWIVSVYWGETREIRRGDVLVFTADRVLHGDEALFYRDALVTRSKKNGERRS